MSKDAWIQKAKALLFDFTFYNTGLTEEAQELINEGGGYDYQTESSVTPLRWTGE